MPILASEGVAFLIRDEYCLLFLRKRDSVPIPVHYQFPSAVAEGGMLAESGILAASAAEVAADQERGLTGQGFYCSACRIMRSSSVLEEGRIRYLLFLYDEYEQKLVRSVPMESEVIEEEDPTYFIFAMRNTVKEQQHNLQVLVEGRLQLTLIEQQHNLLVLLFYMRLFCC
ncbi:hypothetical protein IFM89_030618, partial [Coptis chinensis]